MLPLLFKFYFAKKDSELTIFERDIRAIESIVDQLINVHNLLQAAIKIISRLWLKICIRIQ